MSSEPLPVYDCNEPARLQENDWDCSVESTEWALYAWGRAPSDDWLEQSMQAAGVVNPAVGLCDASGAGLADWVNTEYGEFGYAASNEPSVIFDDVAAEAALGQHPLAIGGRAWGHWSGVRGYSPSDDLILLANPAPGYKGVDQVLSRDDWARLGTWSMVRVTHPEAEGQGAAPGTPDLDYSPWYGAVGSGLLEMMQQDNALPAQSRSTWLPLGSQVADIEEAMGENGVIYRWALGINAGFRHRPS